VYAVAAFLCVTILNEVLGYFPLTRDWIAFFYVTLKFIVLPAAALCGVTAVAWRAFTGRALSWAAWVGGAVGLAYLVGLYLYPLPLL
jgi:hypothetical protein